MTKRVLKLNLNASLLNKQAKGYARIMQVMTGQVPSIHTFGIMSADNPMNEKKKTPEENNKGRKEFKDKLKQELFGYIQHHGVYDRAEKAFFIANVPRTTLIRWGEGMRQESVIFGTVDREQHKVVFEYIEGGSTTNIREVVMYVKGNVENYYSICKGRKFRIPFFDDDYAPEVKLSYTRDELSGIEGNEPHLAALETEAEFIRKDAAGTMVGMGIMGHRHRVMTALNSLKTKAPAAYGLWHVNTQTGERVPFDTPDRVGPEATMKRRAHEVNVGTALGTAYHGHWTVQALPESE